MNYKNVLSVIITMLFFIFNGLIFVKFIVKFNEKHEKIWLILNIINVILSIIILYLLIKTIQSLIDQAHNGSNSSNSSNSSSNGDNGGNNSTKQDQISSKSSKKRIYTMSNKLLIKIIIVAILCIINNVFAPILYYFFYHFYSSGTFKIVTYVQKLDLNTLVNTPILSVTIPNVNVNRTSPPSHYSFYNICQIAPQIYFYEGDTQTLFEFTQKIIDDIIANNESTVINEYIFNILSYFVSQKIIEDNFDIFGEDIKSMKRLLLDQKWQERWSVYEEVLSDILNKLSKYGYDKEFYKKDMRGQVKSLRYLEKTIIETEIEIDDDTDLFTRTDVLNLLQKLPKSYTNEFLLMQKT